MRSSRLGQNGAAQPTRAGTSGSKGRLHGFKRCDHIGIVKFKRFGGIVATQDVSLNVSHGARHALIGPNGAGKSTFFNMISGVDDATEGEVRVAAALTDAQVKVDSSFRGASIVLYGAVFNPTDTPADVGHVAHHCGVSNDPALVENRHRRVDVVDVPGAHPRIVGDHHVAGPQRFRRKLLQKMLVF